MTNEQLYYDALKAIATAEDPDRLRKVSVSKYGLDYVEAIEMAYENVIEVAKAAIRGKRRPKDKEAQ